MNGIACPMALSPTRAPRKPAVRPLWLWGACAASLGVALCSATAYAADPAPAAAEPASASGDDTGVITVTAQRRKEDAKNVPLSVSVMSGEELAKRKILNFEDFARVTPGVAVYNTGGSNLSRIFIRGVSSTQGTATVAVYLDDVSLTAPNLFFTGATLPRLMDIDHVETLRGPQGTLFGASALGGALRFIANKPDLNNFGGSFSGDVSGTDHAEGANYQIESVLNVPIVSDKLALRVAVQDGKQSGYVDRIDGSGTVHKGVNQEHAYAVRATLLYKASDALSIEPALLWQKTDADGTGLFYLNLPRYEQSKLVAEPNSDQLFVPSLTVHDDLGGGIDATSVTSYLRRTNFRQLDNLTSSNGIAAELDPTKGKNYTLLNSLASPYDNNVTLNQWTQEVRLGTASIKDSGKPYELQVGAYFSNQKVLTDDREYVTGLGALIKTLYGVDPATNLILGAPLVNDLNGSYTYTTTRREFAIFAEGSYMLLPRLKVTVGGRQSFSTVDYTMIESGPYAIGAPPSLNAHSREHPFTPKFALTYDASREASFYANVSKGYRLGGNNSPLPTTCQSSVSSLGLNAQGSYTPDSLWSYEGGAKLRLFGNRLTINGSGYYIDWKNIQQSISLSCGYVTTVNAGSARSYGGELEISARISKALTVGATGSLVDAKVSQAAAGAGTANGQWLLNIPRNSFTGYFDFEQPLSDRVTGTAHLDANFIGSSHGSFALTNPDYYRPAYATVNGSIGLRFGAFDAMLYVKNLLNEDKIIQRPSVVGIRQGLIIQPRTIGINGRYHF